MADDPAEAGEPRTHDVTRTYENAEIRVHWDASRCIHTAICLQMLPAVFDVASRPWISLGGADAHAIAETIRACPTGALRYDSEQLGPETAPEPTTVEVRPNGPLLVRGKVTIHGPGGRSARDEARVALCRCGASGNKPYCDNSHRLVGFRDPGLV